MTKTLLIKIGTIFILSLFMLTSITAQQQYKLSDQCSDPNYAKEVDAKTTKVVELISQHKETQAVRAELEKNNNYIPKYYLTIEDQAFERPNYTGNYSTDIVSFREAIYSWISFDLQRANDLISMLQTKKTIKF